MTISSKLITAKEEEEEESSRNCQKHLSVDVLNLLTQSEKNDLIKCKTCETMN